MENDLCRSPPTCSAIFTPAVARDYELSGNTRISLIFCLRIFAHVLLRDSRALLYSCIDVKFIY